MEQWFILYIQIVLVSWIFYLFIEGGGGAT